jgi:ribosome-associated heat shock protein Hsp15
MVLDIPDNRVSAKLDIYRRNDTPAEAYQHLELLKLSKEHYRKNGTGRPTKKETEETSTNLVMKLKQKKTTFN